MSKERDALVSAADALCRGRFGISLDDKAVNEAAREALLRDAQATVDAYLAALPVGDGEPVASAVSSADYWQRRGHHVCPDCAGTRVRSYRQADHLGGQYVDVPCSTCTTPPPAAVPAGWLRAIDDALVVSWIGTAESADTYEQARDKLHKLISQEIAIATDPAVNGGFVLVPLEPTKEMIRAALDAPAYGHPETATPRFSDMWRCALAARPDAPAGEKGT